MAKVNINAVKKGGLIASIVSAVTIITTSIIGIADKSPMKIEVVNSPNTTTVDKMEELEKQIETLNKNIVSLDSQMQTQPVNSAQNEVLPDDKKPVETKAAAFLKKVPDSINTENPEETTELPTSVVLPELKPEDTVAIMKQMELGREEMRNIKDTNALLSNETKKKIDDAQKKFMNKMSLGSGK
ncbi:MAG: hypothetical protein LBI42_03525 [Chitinispirillales bacterium]|jgi:hypothetical protein|nr:hypothetical protein [Chitinispirillales bacterium]